MLRWMPPSWPLWIKNKAALSGAAYIRGDLIGAEAIFLEKGEEMTPGFILPLIITVAVIALAAVIIVIILVKKGNKQY